MREEQLKAMKERAEKATAGPWIWDTADEIMKSLKLEENVISAGACQNYGYVYLDDDDAQFIAHAREDVPALIAEVERLQNALKEIATHNIFLTPQLEIKEFACKVLDGE